MGARGSAIACVDPRRRRRARRGFTSAMRDDSPARTRLEPGRLRTDAWRSCRSSSRPPRRRSRLSAHRVRTIASYLEIGRVLDLVRTAGGRVHTFTQGSRFGGGSPRIRLAHEVRRALRDECLASQCLCPRARRTCSGLAVGNHRFMCCFSGAGPDKVKQNERAASSAALRRARLSSRSATHAAPHQSSCAASCSASSTSAPIASRPADQNAGSPMSNPSRDASSAGGAEPPARRRSKYGSTSESPSSR